MKVLDAGHDYSLNVLDGNIGQRLTFVKRQGNNYPFNNTNYPGTNCQEVIRALIDRVLYLNQQVACSENQVILAGLRSALYAFEIRASRRHGRELTCIVTEIEKIPLCSKCGHIGCNNQCL